MPSREIGKARARSDLAAAQAASLPASVDASELSRRQRSERGTSLRSQLANLPLFEALEPASLHELILRARVVTLEAGKVLFRQGEPSNSLYVVVDGAVHHRSRKAMRVESSRSSSAGISSGRSGW